MPWILFFLVTRDFCWSNKVSIQSVIISLAAQCIIANWNFQVEIWEEKDCCFVIEHILPRKILSFNLIDCLVKICTWEVFLLNLLWILLIIYVKQLQRLHIFLFIRLSSIYHSEKFYVQKLAEENIPNLCIITSLFFVGCLFCWRKSDLLRLNYHFAKLFRTFPQVEKSRSLLFIQIEYSSRHKMTIRLFYVQLFTCHNDMNDILIWTCEKIALGCTRWKLDYWNENPFVKIGNMTFNWYFRVITIFYLWSYIIEIHLTREYFHLFH